jgi:hypothetical protein
LVTFSCFAFILSHQTSRRLQQAQLQPAPPVNDGKVEKEEIRNAVWRQIPGSGIPSSEEYKDNAMVDINGMSRNDDVIIFDVINPDWSYGRLEANCRINQIRALRMGDVEQDKQVSFITINHPWSTPSVYQEKLLNFACNIPELK